MMPEEVDNLTGHATVEFVKNHEVWYICERLLIILDYCQVVIESARSLRLFVTRRGPFTNTTRNISVTYETQDNTALNGKDYGKVSNGQLTFEDNEYEKYIDIAIYDDKQEEKDETFYVTLTGASGEGNQ